MSERPIFRDAEREAVARELAEEGIGRIVDASQFHIPTSQREMRRRSKKRRQTMLAERESGMTTAEIAARHGVHPARASALILEAWRELSLAGVRTDTWTNWRARLRIMDAKRRDL